MGLRLTCLAVLVLGSGALTSGCLSNSNEPDAGPEDAGGFNFDSSIAFDTFVADAYVPDSTIPDASVPDTATVPDTSIPVDAAPLPVTVVAVDTTGAPESGINVVFSDATGAVLTTVLTSAAGTVSEEVPPGSQVTVAFPSSSGGANLLTIVGVAPGDKLTAVDAQRGAGFNEQLSITALAPLDAGTDGGALEVSAGTTCHSTATAAPIDVNLSPGCEIAGKFPLLATANDTNGNPLYFAFHNENSVALDGGLDEAGQQPISLAGDPWAPVGAVTLSAINAPNGTIGLVLDEVSGSVPYRPNDGAGSYVFATDGGVQVAATVHPGYADFTQTEAFFQTPVSGSGGWGVAYQLMAVRSAGAATSPPPLDLSTALPPLTNALLDYANAARPTVSWSSAAPLTAVTGSVVGMSWSMSGPNGASQSTWTFVLPPSASSVQAPALPSGLAPWAPATGASFGYPNVIAAAATFLPDYGAFRAASASIAVAAQNSGCFFASPPTPCLPPLPVDGTLQLTIYVEGS